MVEVISTDKAPSAIGPYSQGIIYGNLVFTSGQIPIDPKTGIVVQGGIEEQVKLCFENLKGVLEKAGSGLDKVLKTSVFIKDMNDFTKINAVYSTFFSEPYPSRSCVEVSRLPKDALIEIEAIAFRGDTP
jgi:2-iminobutanoate/2-iminopropanoate deaminase